MKRDLAALAAREWDLVVVGAGIHGAAVAWDAAQRGLAVALVEREDFGAGASWNSLKTIHGGMRHLQRLDVASLRESARERRTLLRIAPELVEPLRFLVPCRGLGIERPGGARARADPERPADARPQPAACPSSARSPPAARSAPRRRSRWCRASSRAASAARRCGTTPRR